MSVLKVGHAVSATLVGDVVASRDVADRAALHAALLGAIEAVNADAGSEVVDPVRITVGDEFQGRFETVGAAVHASLLMRLNLLPEADLRFGVGWGLVTILDADGTQDGPGWWAAREAIQWVAKTQGQAALGQVRTAYRLAEGGDGPGEAAINAAMQCRDHLIGSLDDRSRRILGGLLSGTTQAEIAEAEGISASAISQRVRRDGLGVLVSAAHELRRVR
ncbi:MAG: SatD family protein [Dermatophilaceae bacterium]